MLVSSIKAKIRVLYKKLRIKLRRGDLEAAITARERVAFNDKLNEDIEIQMENLSSRGLLGAGLGAAIIRKYIISLIDQHAYEVCDELSAVRGGNKRNERILSATTDVYFDMAVMIYGSKPSFWRNEEDKTGQLEKMDKITREQRKMHYVNKYRVERLKNKINDRSEWKVRFVFMLLGILLSKLEAILAFFGNGG